MQARNVKEGLLYHQNFVYEGEYISNYIPHGNGICFFATGEVLMGKTLFKKEISGKVFYMGMPCCLQAKG